jgi:hypothetical protein
MRHFALAAAVSSLTFLLSSRADTPVPSPSDPTVAALINQLSDRDFRVREAASKHLESLGIAVLPALQKARAHADPEVRRRLEELIPPLERAVALMPKRVSLHVTNKTSREILREIRKQTGYKITIWPDTPVSGEKTVYNFNFDQLTFWEALDKLSDTTGLVLQQSYGDDSLRLFYQDSYVPFACCSGPFRIVATGFNYNRSNNFGQLPRNPSPPGQQAFESLQINVMIAVEPKLPILRVGAVKILAAEDEEGRSMVPLVTGDPNDFGGIRHYYGGYYRNYIQQTQANLIWPAKSSKMVRSLKGVIPVTLLADQKATLVTDKVLSAKGKEFKAGPATFRVEDVTAPPGNQIKIHVTEETRDNANDYSQIQSLQQRLEIQDEKGAKLNFFYNSINWQGPSSAQFTIGFQPTAPNTGPPARLVYYNWVLMEHEVPFDFKDLPLP